ncbi:MAG TPA: hypothetical protein VKR52_08065 [Terracidiphilus sp.]|nr:hypothetical protein [Terracidiphilus sp.]
MEDFLAALFEIIAEFLLELAGQALISILARTSEGALQAIHKLAPFTIAIAVALLGAACGGLSILIFPHPLIHHVRVPGISVIISPIMAGLFMAQIGRILRRRGQITTPIESFGYGFAFAFAMATIRLIFVR